MRGRWIALASSMSLVMPKMRLSVAAIISVDGAVAPRTAHRIAAAQDRFREPDGGPHATFLDLAFHYHAGDYAP